jgi:predicted kinase
MQLKIVRGLPGCGKSTYIRKHFGNAVVCSADHFFIGEGGEYRFDPSRIQQAHSACWLAFDQAVRDQAPLIVIDNTSIALDELGAYWLPAIARGYEVEIITLECSVETAIRRNTKRAPDTFIGMLAARLASTQLPGYWQHTQIRTD